MMPYICYRINDRVELLYNYRFGGGVQSIRVLKNMR